MGFKQITTEFSITKNQISCSGQFLTKEFTDSFTTKRKPSRDNKFSEINFQIIFFFLSFKHTTLTPYQVQCSGSYKSCLNSNNNKLKLY